MPKDGVLPEDEDVVDFNHSLSFRVKSPGIRLEFADISDVQVMQRSLAFREKLIELARIHMHLLANQERNVMELSNLEGDIERAVIEFSKDVSSCCYFMNRSYLLTHNKKMTFRS